MAFTIQGRSGRYFRFLCASILLGSVALTWAQEGHQVQVLVYDDAGVPRSTLHAGELEAGRIFRLAGVRLEWVNCSFDLSTREKERCRFVNGARQFVLRVIPKGKTSPDVVFGQAFLGETGSGKYADVFFDRIQASHDEHGTSLPRLLGAVAAHELGHLLLGFSAHSRNGIMTSLWEPECLRRMNMGGLLFTREQALQMQSKLDKNGTQYLPSIAHADPGF